MALKNKALGELMTLTRATGGGRFNTQGLYEWLPASEPRIDYDPVTKECLGILIEEQRTNLLPYSDNFSNAGWVRTGILAFGSGSVVNTAIAPDGTLSADKIVEDTSAASAHSIYGGVAGLPDSTVHTASFFLKAAERSRVVVALMDKAGATRGMVFNLLNGVVSSVAQGGIVDPSAFGVQAVGNGWYRCWVAHSVGTGGFNPRAWVFIHNGAAFTYTGDGTSGIYIWGAQLEAGAFPTSYIPTTTAQVTRAADLCSVSNLSPWYRKDEGTLMADFAAGADTRDCVATCLQGSDDQTDTIRLRINNAGTLDGAIVSGGILRSTNAMQPVAANTLNKSAVTFKVGSARGAMNGVLSATPATPTTLPAVSSLRVGTSAPLVFALNGHIRRIRYIPRRISDTELQALTAI